MLLASETLVRINAGGQRHGRKPTKNSERRCTIVEQDMTTKSLVRWSGEAQPTDVLGAICQNGEPVSASMSMHVVE